MKRSILFFLYLMVFILICAGCAERHLTKTDGTSSVKNESATKQTKQSSAAAKVDKQNSQTSMQSGSQEKTTGVSAAAQNSYNLADIHFDFDRYNIRTEDREILSHHADFLFKNKKIAIVIEGHCDERGTAEYNLALGNRRAMEAKKYLINSGIRPERIKTISYGMERPVDPGHNEEAWAKNRRDHFVINN
ncbi:MAG: hypothetical protein APR62_08715 [Smithella sp. SDB]|nr:MAG: hypothetical protein APR62_08715 [Smithella sp. SDB]